MNYAQSRIQGRLSKWPSDRDWLALGPVKVLRHYLETARRGPIGIWLDDMPPAMNAHAYSKARQARVLASVVGEEGLSGIERSNNTSRVERWKMFPPPAAYF